MVAGTAALEDGESCPDKTGDKLSAPRIEIHNHSEGTRLVLIFLPDARGHEHNQNRNSRRQTIRPSALRALAGFIEKSSYTRVFCGKLENLVLASQISTDISTQHEASRMAAEAHPAAAPQSTVGQQRLKIVTIPGADRRRDGSYRDGSLHDGS